MNNIIIYFPLGAGGNLIRNIISLDTAFEFYDGSPFHREYVTTQERFDFTQKFYQESVTPDTWLDREWRIRTALHVRHYEENGIAHWNPDARSVYLIHGETAEMYNISINKQLTNFNRSAIEIGNAVESVTKKGLWSCYHLFVIPDNIDLFTKIYATKNGTLNQFNVANDVAARYHRAEMHNRNLNFKLLEFQKFIQNQSNRTITIRAEDLFVESGAEKLIKLLPNLGAKVPDNMITTIHSIWLQSTKQLYYNSYGEELKL